MSGESRHLDDLMRFYGILGRVEARCDEPMLDLGRQERRAAQYPQDGRSARTEGQRRYARHALPVARSR